MQMLLEAALPAVQRAGVEWGHANPLIIAVLIFLFITIMSGRRLFVH